MGAKPILTNGAHQNQQLQALEDPMKIKTLLSSIAASLLIAAAPSVYAYTPDTLLCSANLTNSSEAAELALASSCADETLTLDFKVDVTSFLTDESGNRYIDVAPEEPGYFLLKFGTGNTKLDDSYVFQNIAELTKLVWTDAQVNSLSQYGGKLSHYTLFNGSTSSSSGTVSEPGTSAIALLGLGLLGAALRGRRRAK
jgi:MYXO-CTERM domain-containing protein